MFNTIKATLRKLADITPHDFLNLLQWGTSPIDATNPNLLVASATDENGAVAYTTVEPTLILSGYALRPKLTEDAAILAGDAMDSTIAHEAKARGVARVLIVLPPDVPSQPDEQVLRVVERKIPAQHYDQAFVPDLKIADSPSAWIN